MQNFLSQGWVGSIIGLIGIILAIIFYIKQNKKRILAYQSISFGLIAREEQQLPQNVKITFDDILLDQLTLTQIWLWNDGNETIDGNQIVSNDPIRYIFDTETKILSASIVSTTREVNKAKITSILNNEIKLSFDFFDQKDGIKIEILHTGEKQNPKITGTIKGMPHGIKYFSSSKEDKTKNNEKLKNFDEKFLGNGKTLYGVTAILGIIMVIISLLPDSLFMPLLDMLQKNQIINNRIFTKLFFFTAGIVYIIFSLFIFFSRRKKYPETLDNDKKENKIII